MFLFKDDKYEETRQPEMPNEEELLFQYLFDEYLEKKSDFIKARDSVPNYTAQHNPEDYYAEEQEQLTFATRNLLTFFKETTKSPEKTKKPVDPVGTVYFENSVNRFWRKDSETAFTDVTSEYWNQFDRRNDFPPFIGFDINDED